MSSRVPHVIPSPPCHPEPPMSSRAKARDPTPCQLPARTLRRYAPQGKRSTQTEKASVRSPAYLRRFAPLGTTETSSRNYGRQRSLRDIRDDNTASRRSGRRAHAIPSPLVVPSPPCHPERRRGILLCANSLLGPFVATLLRVSDRHKRKKRPFGRLQGGQKHAA